MNEIGIEELYKLFDVDFEKGLLIRKVTRGGRALKGSIAGHTDKRGYVSVRINNALFQVHRIIWAMYHNKWPTELIDHIDRKKSNNSIYNLREASHSQNLINKEAVLSSSKFRGVHLTANNTYCAQISILGKIKYLGTFKTEDEASLAYETSAKKEQGDFYKDPEYVYATGTSIEEGKSTKSSSGYKGITKKGDKWIANITINKRRIRIGTFETLELAREAYQKEKVGSKTIYD